MKAFVTGATGFLGTHLVQQLDKAGWDIVALVRQGSDLREVRKLAHAEIVYGDILDRPSLEAAMPRGVDAVFHMAASVGLLPHRDEHKRFDVNQQGTKNVVEVALAKDIGRFIYTSTVLTYDFHACRPLTEVASKNLWCEDPYIKSKRLADDEVDKGLAAGLDVVYLHPSAVFGAYDKVTWSKMFREVKRGMPLPFAPPSGGSVCHARPVAAAHVSAYSRAKRGEHYILGGPDVTWLQVMQSIAEILGTPGPRYRTPKLIFKPYGWVEFTVSSLLHREPMLTPHTIDILCEEVFSDSTKAITELGYAPSTLKTMLLDCYEWMVQEGMLAARKAPDMHAEPIVQNR